MSDPVAGIKDILVGGGVGLFGGTAQWAIYIGKLVEIPDDTISIFGSPGGTPNPRWLLDYPGVQVIVRGNENGYVNARAKAQKIKDLLLGLPTQVIGGDHWLVVTMPGDIAPMGMDVKRRPMFSLNFKLIIEPAVTAGTNREPL